MGRIQPQARLAPHPKLTIGFLPSVTYRYISQRSCWKQARARPVVSTYCSRVEEDTPEACSHAFWGVPAPLTAALLWQTLLIHSTVTVALPTGFQSRSERGEQVKWGYMAFYKRTPNLLRLEHLKDFFIFFVGKLAGEGQSKKGKEVKH